MGFLVGEERGLKKGGGLESGDMPIRRTGRHTWNSAGGGFRVGGGYEDEAEVRARTDTDSLFSCAREDKEPPISAAFRSEPGHRPGFAAAGKSLLRT